MSKQHKLSRTQRSRQERLKAKKILKEEISRRLSPLDGQKALRFQVLQLFARAQRLHDVIDAAFGYQPFIANIAPTVAVNVQRFNLMIDLQLAVTKLSGRAMELWLLAAGLKKEDNWVPLLIENGRQQAKLGISKPNEESSSSKER